MPNDRMPSRWPSHWPVLGLLALACAAPRDDGLGYQYLDGEGAGAAAQPDRAAQAGRGSQPGRFELIDLYGQSVTPLESQRPVTVLFTATDCSISSDYASEVSRLIDQYGGEVDFWIVYADPNGLLPEIRLHAKRHDTRARVARDMSHHLVRRVDAAVTPTAAVFARGGELIYSGRIDDLWVDFDHARSEPTVHDLERILLAVLSGDLTGADGPIRTTAVGCPIPSLP